MEKIYNDKGKQVGKVKDEHSNYRFGIFTDTYEVEKAVDPDKAAKHMLKARTKQHKTIHEIGDTPDIRVQHVTEKDAQTG